MSDDIRDFNIDIPKTALDDLDIRLRHVRWPDPEPVEDWSQAMSKPSSNIGGPAMTGGVASRNSTNIAII